MFGLYKGRRVDDGEWVEGYLSRGRLQGYEGNTLQYCIDREEKGVMISSVVDSETIGKYTGYNDRNGKKIYTGDITMLRLADGSVRFFVVDIRTVNREVKNHPSFDGDYSKVAITGVVFLWGGFELFPIVHGDGHIDTSDMVRIGSIHDENDPREAKTGYAHFMCECHISNTDSNSFLHLMDIWNRLPEADRLRVLYGQEGKRCWI